MRLAVAVALFGAASTLTPAEAARPIAFASQAPRSGTLVLPLRNAGHLSHASPVLDQASRQAVERALADAKFSYDRNEVLTVRAIGPWSKIVVIGTGPAPFGPAAVQEFGGIAARETGKDDGPVTLLTATFPSAGPEAAGNLAVGAELGAYSFDKYKFADPAKPKSRSSAPLTIVTADVGRAESAHRAQGRALTDAVAFTRDLINEPANAIYPETFVERTREAFRGVANASIEVLDVPAMERLGMGSILSVGKGSVRPPRMLIVHYRGAGGQPVALAGKGITFDSGGISLKPGSGMWEMKGDMSGAAAVVGAVLSLARSRAPVNVAAIAALAENMPSGSASRPGDVVKAYNGKTIEILNTDAEGRLVLADAVAYAERNLKAAAIVDVATLTGSKVTAVGDEYASSRRQARRQANCSGASRSTRTTRRTWSPRSPTSRMWLKAAPPAQASAHISSAISSTEALRGLISTSPATRWRIPRPRPDPLGRSAMASGCSTASFGIFGPSADKRPLTRSMRLLPSSLAAVRIR
jgi:leucyl aminopeptidase